MRLTSTCREAVVSGAALWTRAADDARLAPALSSELLAVEAEGAVDVAGALHRLVVVVGGEGEDRLATEASDRRRDLVLVTAAARDELCWLVHRTHLHQLRAELLRRHNHHVVEPDGAHPAAGEGQQQVKVLKVNGLEAQRSGEADDGAAARHARAVVRGQRAYNNTHRYTSPVTSREMRPAAEKR